MLNCHALEVNRTTGTVLLDGLPLSSIAVKNPSGSVRVDAPEVGE